jgi:ribosome-associated protein
VLRWNAVESSGISEPVRQRFLVRFGSRLSADGSLVLMSDRFRDQGKNRQDCLDKLAGMLREVAAPPRPRQKTRPTRSSKRKRQDQKRQRGETKRARGRVNFED